MSASMAETASSIALDLQDLRDELLNRVARFLVMEAPAHQIAIATGLTEEKVSKLADTQLVKDKMASLQSEQLDQADKLRRGWDAVEEEALGTVLHTLQANPDPDYALRAAAVANKAERRNGNGVKTIDASTNVTATITLSQVFIESLQHMQVGQEAMRRNAKRVDALPIQDAEKVLLGENDEIKLF